MFIKPTLELTIIIYSCINLIFQETLFIRAIYDLYNLDDCSPKLYFTQIYLRFLAASDFFFLRTLGFS